MRSRPKTHEERGSGIYLVESRGSAYSEGMSPSPAESSRPEPTEWPSGCVGLGEHWFHPETGELHAKSGEGESKRLPPQPARLLKFLIDKRGAIAGREEIRELLWPDVEVDFDQGLHFCVRQVRAALGDSAGEPKYIQTLARRGYRLVVPVEVPTEPTENLVPATSEAEEEDRPAASAPSYRSLGLGIAATVAVVLAAAVWMAAGFAPRQDSELEGAAKGSESAGQVERDGKPMAVLPERPTLAIMSFRAPAEADAVETHRIADLLLARMSAYAPKHLGLVGPTTTAAYDTDLYAVAQLTRDLPVDFVINGRFFTEGEDGENPGEPRIIVELIRAEDGAHEWVGVFDPRNDPEAMAKVVGDGLVDYFGLTDSADPLRRE